MPVRFGVTVAPDPSPAVWRDKVRALEDSPVDVLLVNDHLTGLRYAPMVALAAAAEHSTRLRLGTVVLANDYRHPAILAKEAATLDLLAEGRLELGIGAGWMRSDYDQTGMPFDPAAVRLARMREAVEVLRGAWSDTPFSYHGDHYRVDGLDLAPRPVQRPHPPLLMGGGGRVMLRYAAREADIVNITNRTAADGRGVDPADVGLAPLLAKLALIREAAVARSWAPEISVGVRAVSIGGRTSRVHSAVADHFDALRGTPSLLEGGSAEAIVDQLLYWHQQHGISYFILGNDADLRPMLPVMERVRAQLR
ncbi:TIGR03621 family F420-dependent LLM class oxidoreductase [Streptomyces malaysiensis]|uniref:Coenzyme F420-dependent N5 N10-methylene tetrahydromethanopterin reductase-like protein n=1 Tax=Streptomyces malaysiensis TaxID=92644 RepID=A0A7X5X2D5_STRMQ|nr:TIGR03621 family F420-dependent LLM class oxidoreductase [Streptomyces malaysiensis]NIY64196.1 coenzyme F420-dependent N5 N10-methylene tetrahydromethanopterin reductase-like protein [Streptomyces malaysiensis]